MTSTEAGVRAPSEVDAMRHALALARRGPAAGPNPRVGCVLVGADDVGAEIGALRDLADANA